MTDLPSKEELRYLIIEAYTMTGLRDPVKFGLRPSEIIKHIIHYHKLQLSSDEILNLNMRISRLLHVMVDEEIFEKNIVRSGEVYYKLSDDIFTHFNLDKDTEWVIELPPIFALYGHIKKTSIYDVFRKDLLDIISNNIETQIKGLWEQYLLLEKYSFDDWNLIQEIMCSDTASPAQKMEAVKTHNLLFQRVIYQKEVSQRRNEHIKWTNRVKIELPIELYNKLRNHAIERKDTPNELACKVIQKYLDEYVGYE